MDPILIINPMKSRRPTGLGVAGDAIVEVVPPEAARPDAACDRWFRRVNDAPLPQVLRAGLRVGLVQLVPWLRRRERLLFTSQHGPLWRTGRHAVIVHDTIPLQFPEQSRGQTRYFQRWLPRVLAQAERVVTISETVRAELRRKRYPGIEHADVIPSWSPRIQPVSSPVGSTAREPRELLVVGARYSHKNIDVVLTALTQLNIRPDAPVRLTLAGCTRSLWGRAWGGLEWFEQRGWVRVIERVEDDELAQLYRKVSALVFPSLAEGQGLPPLEAMAQGCPVICSDRPVLRETCGGAADYFSPDEPRDLTRVVTEVFARRDPAVLDARAAAVQATLARFSREELRERWRVWLAAWR